MGSPALLVGGRPACVHCRRRTATRSGGLCWGCEHTPGVRDLHPSAGVRGVGLGNFRRPPPPTPCQFPPGSPGKIAAMAERAAAGFDLWNPDDADGPAITSP